MSENQKLRVNKVMDLMEAYCKIVEAGLYERWDKYKIEIYDAEIYEVIGGLLARQATLTTQLAKAPPIWNGHVAPLILRCMTDAHITLAWILRDPKERAKEYILHGLGQEKLFIEHLKTGAEESDRNHEQVEQLIEAKEAWLNSQRRDFLTEVNIGSWTGISTRDMAKEADCEGLYKFAYTPFSGPTHNMWQHISVYNLKACRNPLHKYHKVPTIIEDRSDPHYVYLSAKYVNKSYKLFDDTYNIKIETPLPLDWFVEEFNKLLKNEGEEDKNLQE